MIMLMFSSLKVKNFRLYWFGMLISLIGTWVQTIALSWLVFDLTKSSFLLGLVGFLGSIPMFLFSLLGGVAADRFNKRNILLATQNIFMILAFILAMLTQFKIITVNQIMVIAFLNGLVMAFDGPTRQSMVVELVGKNYLLNAIALNSAAFNSARIIGPAIAGILISVIGSSGCFYINGISFIAVIIALLLIKDHSAVKRSSHTSWDKDLFEGLRFILGHEVILALIIMVGMTSLFGISYVILMPVFAQNVLHIGAKGFGMLMYSAGLGALLAALFLARMGEAKNTGKYIILSSIIFSLSLILFSLAKIYILCLSLLVIIGFTSVTAISLINNALQNIVADEFRGRVMSAFMFTFAGVMPFGNLIAGSLAQFLGVSLTIMISGVICLIFFAGSNLVSDKIWKI